jgi:hypothetical protein
MKSKAITLLSTAAVTFATAIPALAGSQPEPNVVAIDAVVMRPALFVSTVAGSAAFVVSLPVTLISGSVKSTAHALVVTPAKATFARPLGDAKYFSTAPVMAQSGIAAHY